MSAELTAVPDPVEPPTVVQALAAVMGRVQAVHKGDQNKAQGFSFRGIDSVMNAVGPALRAEGVVVLPTVKQVEYTTVEVGKNRTQMQECRLLMRFTFHGPAGDTLECTAVGVAMDAGDKAAPKAHSVAFRTALLQALCIPTDEPDPDAQVYQRADAPEPRTVAKAKRELLAAVETRIAGVSGSAKEAKPVAAMIWQSLEPQGPIVTDEEMAELLAEVSVSIVPEGDLLAEASPAATSGVAADGSGSGSGGDRGGPDPDAASPAADDGEDWPSTLELAMAWTAATKDIRGKGSTARRNAVRHAAALFVTSMSDEPGRFHSADLTVEERRRVLHMAEDAADGKARVEVSTGEPWVVRWIDGDGEVTELPVPAEQPTLEGVEP